MKKAPFKGGDMQGRYVDSRADHYADSEWHSTLDQNDTVRAKGRRGWRAEPARSWKPLLVIVLVVIALMMVGVVR